MISFTVTEKQDIQLSDRKKGKRKMNKKEQNLYESLLNVSKVAAENLKEICDWKELSLERAKEINRLYEQQIEAEDHAYKIVLHWFREYTKALKESFNETNAIKKAVVSKNADEYLNKYVGAQQIYEAIFGIFRIRSEDYNDFYGKGGILIDK